MNASELFKLKKNHEPYVGEWFHCKVKNVFSKCCRLFFVFKFQTIFSVEVSRRLVCDDDDDDDELYSCVDVFS